MSFFSGFDRIHPIWPTRGRHRYRNFQVYRLGAVLAWSLGRYDSRYKGREALALILDRGINDSERIVPGGAKVLVCFGEIDCRTQLVRRNRSGQSIDSLVSDLSTRYLDSLSRYQELGYEFYLLSVPPSTRREITRGEYRTAGSVEERNRITQALNAQLRAGCISRQIGFIDLFTPTVDAQWLPEERYFMDAIHLGQAAMPLFADEMRRHDPDFTLTREWLPAPR